MAARDIGIAFRKFFLAGKGLSVRTGRYFLESMLVGAATGLVVVGFRSLIGLGSRFITEGIGHHAKASTLPTGEAVAAFFSREALLDPHRWLLVVLPAAGAVLGYLLIKWFSSVEHVRGTDSAIRAYHHRKGYVTSIVIPTKSVASVLTVASGGSAGYEGPVTLIGAACGSFLSSALRLDGRARRILMAAGLAAGIGALFRAPLACALFAVDILFVERS